MSNTAGPSTFVFSADCLRGVLDDNEIVSFGDPHYGIHVRHLAIQVDRDDCAASIRDRKSTRLNSSHQIISYAVFCLKKKKLRSCNHNILIPTNSPCAE